MNYWIFHVRGASFDLLKKEGFLTLYPMSDDYVFLEATKPNQKYVRRQAELGIAILKDNKGPVLVTKEEVDRMMDTVYNKIKEGLKVIILSTCSFGS